MLSLSLIREIFEILVGKLGVQPWRWGERKRTGSQQGAVVQQPFAYVVHVGARESVIPLVSAPLTFSLLGTPHSDI